MPNQNTPPARRGDQREEQLTALIAEAERLCAKASPAPWQLTRNMKTGVKLWDANRHPLFAAIAGLEHSRISPESPEPQWQHDCDFALRARTLLPELLTALRARAGRAGETAGTNEGDTQPITSGLEDSAAAHVVAAPSVGVPPSSAPSDDGRAETWAVVYVNGAVCTFISELYANQEAARFRGARAVFMRELRPGERIVGGAGVTDTQRLDWLERYLAPNAEQPHGADARLFGYVTKDGPRAELELGPFSCNEHGVTYGVRHEGPSLRAAIDAALSHSPERP
jgi:hypothetical protein